MVNVIGVKFEDGGKLYFFDPDTAQPQYGDYVLVETVRGQELAQVVMPVEQKEEKQLPVALKKIIRPATEQDIRHREDNRRLEKEAFRVGQEKILQHKLEMKLVEVQVPFDNQKMIFFFTANGRVDFRGLVKDLAGYFKSRIELRQLGARDEAKLLGGLGTCGRPVCCNTFLADFQPVSIKMAKEQKLSLNPLKISGICGRLMCCLKYEQDQYEEVHRRMPRVGREVITPDGQGTVTELNAIRETVRVRIFRNETGEIREYPLEDLQPVGRASWKREYVPLYAEGQPDAASAEGDAADSTEADETLDMTEELLEVASGDTQGILPDSVSPEDGEEAPAHTRRGEREGRRDRQEKGRGKKKQKKHGQGEGKQKEMPGKPQTPKPEAARDEAPKPAEERMAKPDVPATPSGVSDSGPEEKAVPAKRADTWKMALEQAMKAAGSLEEQTT
ncbi:MAG: stage 0 sporulation family protein [Clostridia bacterium]|nr:stage 0 sporulation family protein [Clostridia bacterium]